MFYVQERRAAARFGSAAGRPRARAGALAAARWLALPATKRFARVLPRVFDAASDFTI